VLVVSSGLGMRDMATSEAVNTAGASPTISDNVRRQLETEARRRDLAVERAAEAAAELKGLPWWEVCCPSNMINAKTLHELDVTVREASDSGRLVVVNFFAPECYACKSMQPKLRQIASSNPDTLFIKVNGFLDEFRGYCDTMGITKIPYFHLYRGNKRVSEFTANMRPEKLALLREEIAAQKPNRVSTADNVEYQTLEA